MVLGFTPPQNGTTCNATLANIGTVVNNFSTVEQATTYGCLYVGVQQIRTLTVTKVVQAPFGNPPSIPSFAYTSVSNVAGSPWGTNFALQPTAVGTAGSVSRTLDYVLGQTVTITETDPVAPWAFTSLSCVDGLGAPMNVTSNRTITLSGIPAVTNPAASAIRCTYTNTYTPQSDADAEEDRGVDRPARAGRQPVQLDAERGRDRSRERQLDLRARPDGAGQRQRRTPSITNQSVIAGTYTLDEVADGTRTGGYVQDGRGRAC